MYEGAKILAVIPARGGSKGLPRKNVLPLNGKPLIAWTIEAARASKYIDRAVISTDDEEIAGVSRSFGADAPFLRPAALATDEARSIDVVLHAVKTLREQFEIIVLLQPTSPLRTCEDIDACIKMVMATKASSCVSVVEVEKSPFWMYEVDKNGRMTSIMERNGIVTRRQELPKVYALNGAVYVMYYNRLVAEKTFVVGDTVAHVMPRWRSVDIDDEFDLKFAEFVMQKRTQ